MTWNKRITVGRERLGISKSEFARRVGVSTATTADWKSGVIKMIDGKNLVKVASVLKVTPEWLITGSGEAGNDARYIETPSQKESHFFVTPLSWQLKLLFLKRWTAAASCSCNKSVLMPNGG